MPLTINPIITSARRSWHNTENKSGTHPVGLAVDLRDDEEGQKFWDWWDTPEGQIWKNENNASILKEEDHYHLQFGDSTGDSKPEVEYTVPIKEEKTVKKDATNSSVDQLSKPSIESNYFYNKANEKSTKNTPIQNKVIEINKDSVEVAEIKNKIQKALSPVKAKENKVTDPEVLEIAKNIQTISDEADIVDQSKVELYIDKAPYESGIGAVASYFASVAKTFAASKGYGLEDAEEMDDASGTAFGNIKKKTALDDRYVKTAEVVDAVDTGWVTDMMDSQLKSEAEYKITKSINNVNKYVSESLGYQKTKYDNVMVGRVFKEFGGSSTNIIDMSNGMTVTYQPRNQHGDSRKTVTNAITVSDYTYDMDFTDGYQHAHAHSDIERLRRNIGKETSEGQKFVTIREDIGKGKYNVKVIPFSELKESDLGEVTKEIPVYVWKKKSELTASEKLRVLGERAGGEVKLHDRTDFINKENRVYRQSYAKLSDLDISKDGNKIMLHKTNNMFVDQGIPLTREMSGSNHNSLRIPGGKFNIGKYQNIDSLNQFGEYLGATVTIISDDGNIVKKVTGSLRDIIRTAQQIQKETGGKEVHFLQSDSGSMNIKAQANSDNVITKERLGINKNQESWAGAAEILLK